MTNEQKPEKYLIAINDSWPGTAYKFQDVKDKGFCGQLIVAVEYSEYDKLQKENQLLITALKTCELEIPKGFDGSGDNLFRAVRDLIKNTLNYCEQSKGE